MKTIGFPSFYLLKNTIFQPIGKSKLLFSAGFLMMSLFSSCHPDSDSENPPDPSGQQTMPTALSVSTSRFSITAGSKTPLTIHAGADSAQKEVILFEQTNHSSLSLGTLDAEGNLAFVLTGDSLKSHAFVPGTAEIKLTDGAKSATVRIYLEPKFDLTHAVINDVSRDHDIPMASSSYPASLGIFHQLVVSVNYFNDLGNNPAPNQEVRAYFFNHLYLPNSILMSPQHRFSDVNVTQPVGIAVSKSNWYTAYPRNQIFQLAMGSSFFSNVFLSIANSQLTSVSSLSTNQMGEVTLLAGIFDGNRVAAYETSDFSLPSIPLLEAPQNTENPIFLTVGHFNEDAIPDLAVWYQPSGKVAVFLGSKTHSLIYNADISSSLQTLSQKIAMVPSAINSGDMDGDGLDDIVITNDTKVGILLNQGNGIFALTQILTLPDFPVTTVAIGNASFFLNHVSDIVMGSKSKKSIMLVRNIADN